MQTGNEGVTEKVEEEEEEEEEDLIEMFLSDFQFDLMLFCRTV